MLAFLRIASSEARFQGNLIAKLSGNSSSAIHVMFSNDSNVFDEFYDS